jgi:hypothetical protein
MPTARYANANVIRNRAYGTLRVGFSRALALRNYFFCSLPPAPIPNY